MEESESNEEVLIHPRDEKKFAFFCNLPLELLEEILQEACRDGADLRTKRNVQLVCRVFRIVFLFDRIKIDMPLMDNPYDPRSVDDSFFYHVVQSVNNELAAAKPFLLYVPYPFFYDLKDFCESLFEWWRDETHMPASYFIIQRRRIVNALYVMDGARPCKLSKLGKPMDLDKESLERAVVKDGARAIFFDPMKAKGSDDIESFIPDWLKKTPWVTIMLPRRKK